MLKRRGFRKKQGFVGGERGFVLVGLFLLVIRVASLLGVVGSLLDGVSGLASLVLLVVRLK